jgi:hypothetical protein
MADITFTRIIPDALVQCVDKYIKLPQNKDWVLSEGSNVPVAKWNTPEEYLAWAFKQILSGPLNTPGCQPEDYTTQIAALNDVKAQLADQFLPQEVS